MMREALRPLVILGVVVAVFATQSVTFASIGNLSNVLGQVAPLIFTTLGQTFVLLTGGFDISVGSVAALAGVAAALGGKVHLVIGIACAVAVGVAAGAVNGVAVGYFRVQPVIATLGMLIFARGAAIMLSGGSPVTGLTGAFTRLAYQAWGPLPISAWLAIGAVVLAEAFLIFAPSARAVLAVGGSEQAARFNGIDTRKSLVLAYVLCGAAVGLAAVLFTARANSGQPTLGFGLEVQSIAAAVIGGIALTGGQGRLWQAAIGALIVGVIANGLNMTGISPFMQDVVMGLTLLAAVLASRFIAIASHRPSRVTTPSSGQEVIGGGDWDER